MIGPPQLLDGLSWHGLGEAQTAPCVGGGPHLSHHRLLQHGCVDTEVTLATHSAQRSHLLVASI